MTISASNKSSDLWVVLALFFGAVSVPNGVTGWSIPLASDPTNVRNQWDLPAQFGGVRIPGASITSDTYHDYFGRDSYSPLRRVDTRGGTPYSADYSYEYGYGGGAYDASMSGRTSSSLYSSVPSSGRVWRYNDDLSVNGRNGWGAAAAGRRSSTRPWVTPALSMANYMQNGGPGSGSSSNGSSGNYDNYNSNNNYGDNNQNYNGNDRYYDDYDDQNRNRYDRDDDYDRYQDQPQSRRAGGPRGTNRYNTVGSVGSVNGANLSRSGRSMQFQNRRDSNIAGRAGRMMDDNYSQFAPDNNSRFESRSPNDAYARGGFRQDPKDGYWKDPNNYSNNNGPTYNQQYPSSSTIPANGFQPIAPGEYVSAPSVRGPYGYEPVGAGGNVPYDNNYYNSGYGNNNANINSNYNSAYDNEVNDDYYSRNGNVVDNRRQSRGRGAPGSDDNYYNLDDRDSNRRMDRGGGLMRYRPTYYPQGGNDYYGEERDDYYDSSGYLYNNEGKRVRRFDPDYDRSEGYYNPDHLTSDTTDPKRQVQNQRRRAGRDVQSGATLRRYDPQWDSNQGLYDEGALYRSDVKGTRSYANAYGEDNRVMPRRRVSNREDPSIGWGEAGGRDSYRGYQEGDYIEDGYDRGQPRGARRGLGRRDRDGERDYYRAGDYPAARGDDTMERFRQGKDVKKGDLYGYETGNTASGKRRINNEGRIGVDGRRVERRRSSMSGGGGSYNVSPGRGGSRGGGRGSGRGGRVNGSGGRDRGLSLDDLNELL
jgi:hypothetical protein